MRIILDGPQNMARKLDAPARVPPAKYGRTRRDLEDLPTGAQVSAKNLGARVARSGAFWAEQRAMTRDEAGEERWMRLDQKRERAWSLDVVHDAVAVWTPELAAAFRTIGRAVDVDVGAAYPDTFGPCRKRCDAGESRCEPWLYTRDGC